MKKSYFKLSILLVSSLTFTQYSCKNNTETKNDTVDSTDLKLDLSLYPVEEKALAYVDSISLTDTVALVENNKQDIKNHLSFLSDQEKYWWNKLERKEKEKFNLIDRMIKEVGYNQNATPEDLKYMTGLAKKIKAQFIMKHELATDTIKDSVHDKYMGELFSVGQKVKDMQKQTLFAELKAEITDINSNQLVNFRAAHAKSAYLYNKSVDSLQTEITQKQLPFTKVQSWY